MPLHKMSSGFKRRAEPDNEANKRQRLDEAGAPPKSASWNGLPVEMVAETARNLITDDVHETARNLNDIGFVDRFHRSVVTSDPQLARIDGG